MALAQTRLVGVSTVNLRRVANLVRGKPVDEAVTTLKFIPSPAAVVVRKAIESATANATNNDLKDREKLKVKSVTANEGPMIRRFRPKARGRAGAFNRATSHVTVVVDDDAEGGE
jgi:large subunit ribosomal protein L22